MRGPAFLFLLVLLAAGASPVVAEDEEQMTLDLAQVDPLGPHRESVDRAVSYLLDHQQPDGCLHTQWGAAPAATAWTAVLLAGSGGDPRGGSPSLVDGLAACAPPYGGEGEHASMNHVAALARHILALAAVNEDPSGFNGRDWVQELRSHHNGLYFQDDDHPTAINDDAFALLALRAAGAPPNDPNVSSTSNALRLAQNSDGGWGITTGSDSNTDVTAAVLQALLRAQRIDRDDEATKRAIDYLEDQSDEETGCLRGGSGFSANPDSTAWAVMALLAVNEDPRASPWTPSGTGPGPWDCLLDRQTDNGGFAPGMSSTTPSLGTSTQVALALALTTHWTATDRPALKIPLNVTGVLHPGEKLVLQIDSAHVETTSWLLPDDQIIQTHKLDWTPPRTGMFLFETLLLPADTPAHLVEWSLEIEKPAKAHDPPQETQDEDTGDVLGKQETSPDLQDKDSDPSDATDATEQAGSPENGRFQELPVAATSAWLALGMLAIAVIRGRRS